MVNYKYKIRLHLHEKKLLLKLRLLHVWLQRFYRIKLFTLKKKKQLITILKSPHVNKKSREQFKSVEQRLVYFFAKKLNVFQFLTFFTFFGIFFEYFTRFIWYQKQGIFYLK